MPPPSIIIRIIRPHIFRKLEIISIRAVSVNKCTLLIPLRILVNALLIQPFIKRTTMVKYTIQNYFHATPVYFIHKFSKKLVTCFQILHICDTADIFCCGFIWMLTVTNQLPIFPSFQQFSFILDNPPNMRVDIIIVLTIIFMIGR